MRPKIGIILSLHLRNLTRERNVLLQVLLQLYPEVERFWDQSLKNRGLEVNYGANPAERALCKIADHENILQADATDQDRTA